MTRLYQNLAVCVFLFVLVTSPSCDSWSVSICVLHICFYLSYLSALSGMWFCVTSLVLFCA